MSKLAIKALEEPLKCDMEIPVTVQYTIAGETVKSGYVTIVYMVGAEMKQNTAHIFFQCSYFIHFFSLSLSGFIQRRDYRPWV